VPRCDLENASRLAKKAVYLGGDTEESDCRHRLSSSDSAIGQQRKNCDWCAYKILISTGGVIEQVYGNSRCFSSSEVWNRNMRS